MMTLVCFPRFVKVQQKGVVTPKWGVISESWVFPLFVNCIQVSRKRGQRSNSRGSFSEIFLSEVRVKASLTEGQFFDTDTHE